jgi:flavin-dependent dehydrogenase
MHDVIIVGARSAGASTALLLARRGYRVLLVDRASFPSDAISSHYIHVAGVARLRRWGGLEEGIVASGAPKVRGQLFDVGAFALRGTVHSAGGTDYGYAPRRTVFDRLLVDAAVAAGAELRTGYGVTGLTFEAGHVSGIRGERGTERARIVVGADGRRSTVARAAGAVAYEERPARTCYHYSYWEGVGVEAAELYWRERSALLAVPTHDGLTMIAMISPIGALRACQDDVQGTLDRALETTPTLRERIAAGRRVERFRTTTETGATFRTPAGPGWALVGDAGHHKNPITAQGMMDAFRDAELLADAIGRGLSGEAPMDAALAAYHTERDAGLTAAYELTDELARLDLPAEMPLLLAALRDDPEQTEAFLGTIAGTTPPEAFYTPTNIQRIMRAAASRATRAG